MSLLRLIPSSSRAFLPSASRAVALRSYAQQAQAQHIVSTEETTTQPAVNQEALPQSPNVTHTWSRSQNPKAAAYDNARFEQVRLDLQPNPPSAMGLVSEDPVRLVEGRKAVCDGGECCWGMVRVCGRGVDLSKCNTQDIVELDPIPSTACTVLAHNLVTNNQVEERSATQRSLSTW